jgi:hypothetical protein
MNKRGFSALNAVIILIVVAIIGFFLYTKFMKKPAMTEGEMPANEEVAAPAATEQVAPAEAAPAPAEGQAADGTASEETEE